MSALPLPSGHPITSEVARFAATLQLESVPHAVRSVARRCMLDFVGVALAGVPEDASRLVSEWVREEGGRPDAGVIGTPIRTSAANAALANGTAGHALDLDDVCLAMRGHPTTVCAPAALAIAESTAAGGGDVLAGYIVGAEVTIALGFAIGRTHYPAGWHSTATLGAVGAAAACARVLRLNEAQTVHALGIAASFASGMRCNFGSMTKPLHAGHAARSGVVAASLAARGFTAGDAALESPIGFLSLFSLDAAPSQLNGRLGYHWSLLEPGICIKRHPCCYGTHHAIDAILELREQHSLQPAEVRCIEVVVAPGGMAALIHNRPTSGLQGKFSLPYVVASALVEGAPTLATFSDGAVKRADVRALMERVACREAPGTPVGADDPRFAEVTLHLADGRTLHRRVDHPRGSPEVPLSDEDLDRKFLDCATVSVTRSVAMDALSQLHRFEQLTDVRQVTLLLRRREESSSGF